MERRGRSIISVRRRRKIADLVFGIRIGRYGSFVADAVNIIVDMSPVQRRLDG
ncbi:hypothetical protein P168DRAFT_26642 [Aspergillus campestris IBT 28561]|uniref:Uncharacterized protein n=1 Tax=Aspergillus campestris (strain IBT 28561) TaxID=1392248 RepID=A0A2I1DGD3_ASPC2|nr:uncharacterized protein P168DRAFT_26642 [Aspergillus campestris IBT 28561]PKY08931.1 hypothetical protein P168DRAFT_26642 [Aspergillus campestris IBT 28561]